MPRGSEELTKARKEEIFLALLKREHDAWITDMEVNSRMRNFSTPFPLFVWDTSLYVPYGKTDGSDAAGRGKGGRLQHL